MTDSDEQKQKIKSTFNMVSDGYDSPGLRFFVNSAEHLINLLKLKGDEALLDIATGTGHVAITAAKALNDGSVVGVDMSDKMLAVAKRKADENRASNVAFKCVDIEKMEFEENSFDVATCAFGLFFLSDMLGGLGCIAKVTKPGGKVALTSFTSSLMEPLSQLALERLEIYGIKPPALSWKKLDTTDKISELMGATGLTDVKIESKQVGYYLDDTDQWWEILWNSGYRGLLSQLNENDLNQFKKDHLKEINMLADCNGIWLNVEVLFAVAIKS